MSRLSSFSCDSMCDQQHRCIKQLSSAGSYDIVEADDLCDSGILLDQQFLPGQKGHGEHPGHEGHQGHGGHPGHDGHGGHEGHPGHGGHSEHSEHRIHCTGCGPFLVQKLRPISREDSAEDYYDILLMNDHSEGGLPEHHEYTPTASLPRTTLISEATNPLAVQSVSSIASSSGISSASSSSSTNPLAVQPVTSEVSLSSCSTSSAYPATSLTVTAPPPSCSYRPAAVMPCIMSTALPTSSDIVTTTEGMIQDRISQICLQESSGLHSSSDSTGSHVEDTNTSPVQLMGTPDLGLPDSVEKDGTARWNTGSEVGKISNSLANTANRGSSNTNDGKDLKVASGGLGAVVSGTSQVANGEEVGKASNARHLGMKSSSTGQVIQTQHPSSTTYCISDPGTSCYYGNKNSRTLQPRHGSDPGTVPVFLKKKNWCDVARAFSEPTASDLVTADLLTEITMSLPSEPSSQSLTESTDSVSTSPSEEDISTCIKTRCTDFLNYTNWKLLLPRLMANELLDRDITDILMNNCLTNLDKGLKFYLLVLPSKGNTAYSRFYQCVSEEDEHSGHRTLLELMDNFNKT